MSQSDEPVEPPKRNPAINSAALFSVGGQVGCAILALILVALLIGIGLDKLLGTKAVFTIILFLGSFPISLYLTYRLAMRSVNHINSNQPASIQSKQAQEEEKRD